MMMTTMWLKQNILLLPYLRPAKGTTPCDLDVKTSEKYEIKSEKQKVRHTHRECVQNNSHAQRSQSQSLLSSRLLRRLLRIIIPIIIIVIIMVLQRAIYGNVLPTAPCLPPPLFFPKFVGKKIMYKIATVTKFLRPPRFLRAPLFLWPGKEVCVIDFTSSTEWRT